MLQLNTELEGKQTFFGPAFNLLKANGYALCSSWQYDRAYFDGTLWRQGSETLYIRLPFHVVSGMLEDGDALIEFQTPYMIKHVVNIGLDRDGHELLTAGGLSQFQEPLDTDGQITQKNKWLHEGEQAINYIVGRLDQLHTS
ncbi:YugN family protein [Lentibacillus saliphilus]|uniref:YugN family protein n=1 Tax=Lentibacillus saliphilus TaxID=2737028 RepID=UPI001C2FA243|nr:YugN family protein [Lentibacillus saliphilus]